MKKTILIFFVAILLLSFITTDHHSTTIVNGKLTIKVNHLLQTTVYCNEPLKTTLSQEDNNSGYLVAGDKIISAFKLTSARDEKIKDDIGTGTRYSFNGLYKSENISIQKKLIITVYDDFPGMALFNIEYTNKGNPVIVNKWVNNHYRLLQNNDTLFWSFQGQSTEARADWILPVKQGFYQKNYMGMNNSDYGGGIPVSDLWRKDIGLAVGHTSIHPQRVSIPVMMNNPEYAELWVEKSFGENGIEVENGDAIETPQTFVMVHHGDAFAALSKFSQLLEKKGIKLTKSPETAYEPVWCAWGYERKFTEEEVIGTLPKVKELGIKWAVIDDGYQKGEGDWNVDTNRFPEGNRAMKQMVQKIHDYGLKAKLWWAPLALDPCTPLWNNHYHDILLLNEDTSPRFISWWDAYYMSPLSGLTYSETGKVLDMFFNDWGFDGLKMDGQHMNNVPPDYNEKINNDNPESAPQTLPDFFKMIYEKGITKKPDAVIENCPCGCCINFYNLQGMNQAVSSDPTSSWQIRLKGKVYHALNPHLAYYGDHVELSDNGNDFASSFGVGAVLGTKFTWPEDNPFSESGNLLTPEKEKVWKKWFDLYNNLMLSKGEYLGNLYDIGFDKPETHVIKKENTLYYAFYANNWNGKVVLKGLDKKRTYRITDYVNHKNIALLKAGKNEITVDFNKNLLLMATPVE